MDNARVTIPTEIRGALKKHQGRTNVGPTKLLKNTRRERPEGLRAHIITNWIEGKTKTADQAALNYVLNLWAQLPDRPERIEITPEIREELCFHRARTGIGSHAITTIRNDCPKGLSPGVIQYWLVGKIKTANKKHLDYVLEVWSGLPDKS